MKRAYKTEIKLAKEQIQKINQSIGICKWLYNSYMAKNKELYKLYKQDLIPKEKAFMSANDFDKYINNEVKVYVSVVIDVHMPIVSKNTNEGIGIDLGLKDFAICSNGEKYKNINKTEKIRKIEKKLKREQKKLSRKYENLKKKGGTATKSNIKKQIVKVQKLHHKLDNIRTDYVNKTISNIINQKPKFITIEDLNVKGMMKNKHLSKAVANEKFYEFRSKLTNKCNVLGIELRIVDRFYPSSKLCHLCGSMKKDLKLKDRIYKCNCGYIEDRDYNASLNLRDCLTYKIAQ
ncbi:MAG: RNA-guided endonuclease InsQ/TnpB family protein [Clostridium sp.]